MECDFLTTLILYLFCSFIYTLLARFLIVCISDQFHFHLPTIFLADPFQFSIYLFHPAWTPLAISLKCLKIWRAELWFNVLRFSKVRSLSQHFNNFHSHPYWFFVGLLRSHSSAVLNSYYDFEQSCKMSWTCQELFWIFCFICWTKAAQKSETSKWCLHLQ